MLLSTRSKKRSETWSLDDSPRDLYLKVLRMSGGNEKEARAISGFKGTIIQTRAQRVPQDGYPSDWTGYTDEQIAILNEEAEKERERKQILYSLAKNIKLYADHKAQKVDGVELVTGDRIGYKGRTEIDAGCFYAPYLPLTVYTTTVIAPGRALTQEWIVDGTFNLQVAHGLDFQAELTQAISNEILHQRIEDFKLITRYVSPFE